jgi:hypothetical protein
MIMARAQTKPHPMETIAQTGSKPVAKSEPVKTAKVADIQPSLEIKGVQLGEKVVQQVMDHAENLSRFMADMLALSSQGREAFRKTVAAAMGRRLDAQGKAIEPDPVEKAARASARTRLSEFVTISKAMDAGLMFKPDWKFHFAVGQARTFLRGQAMASTRGRKAASAEDKVRNYLVKHAEDVGGLEAILEMVQDLIDNPPETETK